MQIKKDEVRLAILREAEKEFYEKGFTDASIRKIVKGAGTTIGNFYNYFESKEAVFEELVNEEYKSFIYFINNHDNIQRPDFLWEIKDVGQWRKVLTQLIQAVMPAFSDKFLLLVEYSRGTKFENTRNIIVELLKEHFVEHIKSTSSDFKDADMGEIIAEQVVAGIILILKKYKDENTRKRLMTEHILYHFIGTMGLLGNWN